MENEIKQKILANFLNSPSIENITTTPININIDSITVSSLLNRKKLITNDGNYYIRYGGYALTTYSRSIEVYSVDSINNGSAIYKFDGVTIGGNSIALYDLKQASDGRFYGVGAYYDSTAGSGNSYLIIMNNFIQDGYIKVNKYYSSSAIGSEGTYLSVVKQNDEGIYYIYNYEEGEIVKFEINIVEGNSSTIASLSYSTETSSGYDVPKLNILGSNLIYTNATYSSTENIAEYAKGIVNIDESFPSSVTVKSVYSISTSSLTLVPTFADDESVYYQTILSNEDYYATMSTISSGNITFYQINLDGSTETWTTTTGGFTYSSSMVARIIDKYAIVYDGSYLYLFYKDVENEELVLFHQESSTASIGNLGIIKQFNLETIIFCDETSVTMIKNIYSPGITGEEYFNYNFALPYYINLFSDSSDTESVSFSRDALTRYYSGNQVTSIFKVPHDILNEGNINMASVYGKTNYLINSISENFAKNQYETAYFEFIYNINVVDNTSGLSILRQLASNRIGNSLWGAYDRGNTRLSKARITHSDSTTSIVELDIPEVTDTTLTFDVLVAGDAVKIEYLSNDENTVYASYTVDISNIESELLTESDEDILTEDEVELMYENVTTIQQTVSIN